MDMKKILQAIDNASTPVEATKIITESNNRLSMAEQITMQHYAKPLSDTVKKPSLLKTYFKEAEEDKIQKQTEKRQLINQYARVIAEKVRLKESYSDIISTGTEKNKPDVIKLDVPLLIRLLEYAREDAETDMDLHNVSEKLIEFSAAGNVLTMDHYDAIVGEQKLLTKDI